MNKFKLKIIDYYDDLKNQIDVECEKILASNTISNEKKEQYSLQRVRFLNEINKISNFNLENYEKIKCNDELLKYKNIDPILFRDKFCFHIRGYETQDGYYKTDLFGKLVITNFFICEDVQKKLSMNNPRSKKLHELKPKDLVLLNVIFSLLGTYWPGKDEIIDISCKETNRINKLFLLAEKVENFKNDDFDCIDFIIKRENIEKCNFSLNSFITKEMINKFKFVNELTLDFNYFSDVDYELLSNFEDLITLKINHLNSSELPCDLFDGLKNLKELIITNNSISSFESEDAFPDLLKLESLDLQTNKISLLPDHGFKGLGNLKILHLAENDISECQIKAFIDLKSLTFLNLRHSLATNIQVEHLNCLINLEVLNLFKVLMVNDYYKCTNIEDLDLPNLRFLGIESDVVPKFKHLKLNFLHINDLKEFDETSLNSQSDLTGVYLELGPETKMDLIKKEAFKSLEKLSFLAFNFYELNQNEINYIENNLEYYGAFLHSGKRNFKTCFDQGIDYVEVSNYEKIDEYFQKELEISDLAKNNLLVYYERYIEVY